ncbi:conjugal transfer protein TraD [Elizabethkingia anophelis]|uniref:conjugal transfer protein TraD n=1 Tax=Elizabethkingia anophelis TaxID=1117645 RepID=UPI0013165567|nr:conjugal transfer protein TraD [Elizabethkingia anophelis]MBE9392237.1 conjugal transfer protein TraD [Elizabethkingia anophelis]MBE9406825.1 conjugal transfer protein TraD [Elizabethkingia anophelis]BBQ06092.1 hypothetical protein JUNP353_0663 [Elizabethkingia anophelis]
MEILILICLILIIMLLAKDKIIIYKRVRKNTPPLSPDPDLPDVLGKPKERPVLSSTVNESQSEKGDHIPATFESESNENALAKPQEEPGDVSGEIIDLTDEEDEWNRYGIASEDNGFAQGVTFEELSLASVLLQKDKMEPHQMEETVAIVQKIQGTELFSLLENSIENASQQIARLLDNSLYPETDSGSSNVRNNSLDDFDIGEFV